MTWHVGHLLIATGIGHTIVGVVLFRDALSAILSDGFVAALWPHLDRLLAFWFLLFSPVCVALGQVVHRAIARGDRPELTLLGWYVLGLGVVGAAALPMSGFWALIVIGGLIFRTARGLERRFA